MSRLGVLEPVRPVDKSPDAFRTISEVADDLDLPQHVLRFWETRFSQIKPLKRAGGRRYYRPDDVDLLKGIRHLLYGEGYTIKGVQRILRQDGIRFVQGVGRGEQSVEAPPPAEREPEETRGADVPRPAPAYEGATVEGWPEASEPVEVPRPLDAPPPAPVLTRHRERLHAVLDDLRECERLMAALQAAPDEVG